MVWFEDLDWHQEPQQTDHVDSQYMEGQAWLEQVEELLADFRRPQRTLPVVVFAPGRRGLRPGLRKTPGSAREEQKKKYEKQLIRL